ncbi:hypothetical protein [Candidatus Entotheonella palauensis]|nr:hypothetical protein [Candidatus Entotheonella palauensis]
MKQLGDAWRWRGQRWLGLICELLTLTLLASCATIEPVPPRSDIPRPYTLAILPWNMAEHRQDDSYRFGMAALKTALKAAPFRPLYSYYPFPNTTRVTSEDISEMSVLWASGFWESGPPQDRVIWIGDQLGVDAVLVYAMYAKLGPDTMWAHLFDIPQNKHYVAEGWVLNYESDTIGELQRLTRDVFHAFTHGREPSGR